VQFQSTVRAVAFDGWDERPLLVEVVLGLIPREVWSCSTVVVPCERPLRKLNERRQYFGRRQVDVVITSEYFGNLTSAMFGVKGEPDRFGELLLAWYTAHVGSFVFPSYIRCVAAGANNLAPKGVKRVRNMQE
jgi:hypothetical protein